MWYSSPASGGNKAHTYIHMYWLMAVCSVAVCNKTSYFCKNNINFLRNVYRITFEIICQNTGINKTFAMSDQPREWQTWSLRFEWSKKQYDQKCKWWYPNFRCNWYIRLFVSHIDIYVQLYICHFLFLLYCVPGVRNKWYILCDLLHHVQPHYSLQKSYRHIEQPAFPIGVRLHAVPVNVSHQHRETILVHQ